jgi:hypothetical protein
MDHFQPSIVPPMSGIADETETPAADHYIVFAAVALAAAFYSKSIVTWLEGLEQKYYRGQRLAAYRRRHAWKKSDIPRLESLGVNRAARSRMEHLEGRGRPVVRPHRPFDDTIMRAFGAFRALVDTAASPSQRRQAVKLWPWWSHYVEALYRGEHELAKGRRLKSPSTEAELSVGAALGISSASVHGICGKIRKMRAEDPESANFPSLALAEYEEWMRTGKNCWDLRPEFNAD